MAKTSGYTVERSGQSTVACSERFRLKSSAVGDAYVIDIARPLATADPAAAIYVLDGNTQFALVCQVVRLLENGCDPIPPAVVIGIGYATEASQEGQVRRRALRARDFTPTEDDGYFRRNLLGGAALAPALDIHTGGADRFRAFITDELQPFVQIELQAELTDRTLVGMSLGGLFTLHTLLTKPTSFTRWIAISPSIWWDRRAMLDRAAGADRWSTGVSVPLFIANGGAEEEETRVNTLELVQRLRSPHYTGLALTYHQFPQETHQSVFPAAVSRGLRVAFKGPIAPLE